MDSSIEKWRALKACAYATGDHFYTCRNILNLSSGTYETEINISSKWIL